MATNDGYWQRSLDWAMGKAFGPGGDSVETFRTDFTPQQAQIDEFDFLASMNRAQGRDAGLAGQQDALIGQLTANAEGRGVPSLAEMQLARSLAQVQSQAAGAVASQRGLNPALAGRMVGQQQAQAAQMAAGQGAMLRAQEQLAAQQLLGQTLAGVRGQEQGMFGMGAQGAQNQNALGSQNFNTTQGLGNQNAQFNALAAQQAQTERNRLEAAQSQAMRDYQAGIMNTASQGLGLANPMGGAPGGGGATGGTGQGGGGMARGGVVRGYADGGEVDDGVIPDGGWTPGLGYDDGTKAGRGYYNDDARFYRASLPTMRVPLDPSDPGNVRGYRSPGERSMWDAVGGEPAAPAFVLGVPEVPGAVDDERNDKVPALLSPGEVVVPRSVVNAPNAPAKAAQFVQKVRQEAQTDPAVGLALDRKRMLHSDLAQANDRRDMDAEQRAGLERDLATRGAPRPDPGVERDEILRAALLRNERERAALLAKARNENPALLSDEASDDARYLDEYFGPFGLHVQYDANGNAYVPGVR